MPGYIPDIETKSLEDQTVFQEQGLRTMLDYVAEHSVYYKKLFQEQNIQINQIRHLYDLQKIPTTSKEDLQLHNMDFLCVDGNQIAEYTATSGTLGSPVSLALTDGDIERLAYNEFLSFELMNIGPADVVQLMLTLDRQFMAGMAYYLGLKKNGATAVRTGPGLPSMQIDIIQRLKSTVLVAVPSFILKLIEYARQMNIDLHQLTVKKVLCIGENIHNKDFTPNALGALLQEAWPIDYYSTYASTEMQTAFTECEVGQGGHHHPELMILEILDDDGRQLGAGEYGEVTITTLSVEAMPLLRYRTGDICCYYDTPCACGRKTKRLSPVTGRKQQMIKYKGTTLYPPAVYDVLNQFPQVKEYVVEVRTGDLGTDDLVLHINTPLSADECERILKPFLQSRLRVIPHINYLSSAEINEMQFPSGSRKAVRFIDHRKAATDV